MIDHFLNKPICETLTQKKKKKHWWCIQYMIVKLGSFCYYNARIHLTIEKHTEV